MAQSKEARNARDRANAANRTPEEREAFNAKKREYRNAWAPEQKALEAKKAKARKVKRQQRIKDEAKKAAQNTLNDAQKALWLQKTEEFNKSRSLPSCNTIEDQMCRAITAWINAPHQPRRWLHIHDKYSSVRGSDPKLKQIIEDYRECKEEALEALETNKKRACNHLHDFAINGSTMPIYQMGTR